MNNSKAFTLIELTAVIVVLAAIFLVSFPALISMLKSDEEQKEKNFINNLCLSGESYIRMNDEFDNLIVAGGEIELSISDMISDGDVPNNLKNPSTDDTINDDILKYTILDDYSFECKYIDN